MKEKFIIGRERMQLLTNVSIPSRPRHGKTVAQPGSGSVYSPSGCGVRRTVKRPLVQTVQDWQKRYNSVCSVLLCLKVSAACANVSVAIPTAWTMTRTPLLTTKDTKVSEFFFINFVLFVSFVVKSFFFFGCGSGALCLPVNTKGRNSRIYRV